MPRAKPRVSSAQLQRTLRNTFGLKRLRDGQAQTIQRVVAGLDTLAIMPTGAGKSLCYQLPAVLLDRRTVVVSPLIALMKDQCDALQALGVRAVQMHSALGAVELALAQASIASGEARIVFTTPERLADADFRGLLQAHGVALLVVDEAHCISQWGHDFRPSFLEIGAIREALGRPAVLALTATATDAVAKDILKVLGIPQAGLVATGIFRPNLHYRAEFVARAADKLPRLLEMVRAQTGAGLVYAATVRAAEQVHDALLAAGESTGLYHGKLGAARRHDAQDAFMNGRIRVMVATNAFGLGVDKQDTRFVFHYQIPSTLDAYYQESGRAGRDGAPAQCTLLFTQGDKAVQQFFMAGRYPETQDFQALYRLLDTTAPTEEAWNSASVVATAGGATGRPERKLLVALGVLRRQGIVSATPDGALRLARAGLDGHDLSGVADTYRGKREQDRAALEAMVAYAQSGRCRWRLLLEHFEPTEAFERCGICDNCRALELHVRAQAIQPAAPADAPVPGCSAPAPFTPGETVRTPRHGMGVVTFSDASSVTVAFANGHERSFQPRFVKAARSGSKRQRSVAQAQEGAWS